MDSLNKSWQAASEEMYKATQSNDKNTDDKKESKKEDDVTDVDFEEVKEDK